MPRAVQSVPVPPLYSETRPDIRGFIVALLEGDKDAAFGTVRNVIRGGGKAESLLTETVMALDDAYRARIDGTPLDPELARITGSVPTSQLERVIGALATAVDSSYSQDATGAKLALTRALATLAA